MWDMNEWTLDRRVKAQLGPLFDSGFCCEWETLCSFLNKPSKPAIDKKN